MGKFFLTRIDPVGVGVQCVAMTEFWTATELGVQYIGQHFTAIAFLLHYYCIPIALPLHCYCTSIALPLNYHCTAMTELGLQLNLEYNKLHYHCSAIGLPLHCHCISIAQALDNHCTVELGVAAEVGEEANREHLPLPAGKPRAFLAHIAPHLVCCTDITISL